MMTHSRAERRGVTLLAVLATLTIVTVLSLSMTLAARDAITTSGNRIGLMRAGWLAEECVAHAMARIDERLQAASDPRAAESPAWLWRDLPRLLVGPGDHSPEREAGCSLELSAAGSGVNVNAADGFQLRRLLLSLGANEVQADSAADALLDWRDEDDVARPLGAEREWYARRGARAPRNGPVADIRELAGVRGWSAVATHDQWRSAVSVEPGRLSLPHASPYALRSLAVSEDAVNRLIERRQDLHEQGREASRGTADELLEILARGASAPRYESSPTSVLELRTSVVSHPDAWILTATGRAARGATMLETTIELRLVLAGSRVAVVRRRVAP